MIWLTTATAFLVFLRAFQQQNVIHGKYGLAVITSYLLAVGEVYVVYSVASIGMSAVPYLGTGGAIGVTLSMWAHRKYLKTS